MLRGVDLAAFAVALDARMRRGGVGVSASGPTKFVEALRHLAPRTRPELYWAARLTLVDRADDLMLFDAVFDAVFADSVLGLDPPARAASVPDAGQSIPDPGGARPGPSDSESGGLPWATRRTAVGGVEPISDAVRLPDLLPSRLVSRADEPFESFDSDDLRTVGAWLEHAVAHWPRRTSRRHEYGRRGAAVDFRATMNRSRRTGFDAAVLMRRRPRRRRRRVVLICDVSGSMQPYTTTYLHLMRAAVDRRSMIRPEVFAFSTSVTKLTAILAGRSPEAAVAKANDKVADRFGGTRVGHSLAELVGSPAGHSLRGSLVVIASDGWDSDDPDVVTRAMARIARRAWRVVWINPRAGEQDYEPKAGSMAAALPYCDDFVPGRTLADVRDLLLLLEQLGDPRASGRSS
ncbi:vWA domain-containing protein [Williamsia sp.]|uniref:vWA domain-containing protein n=1 Tax=Williamsia sp. TaxID=1872085 RepID=UPI002F9321F6